MDWEWFDIAVSHPSCFIAGMFSGVVVICSKNKTSRQSISLTWGQHTHPIPYGTHGPKCFRLGFCPYLILQYITAFFAAPKTTGWRYVEHMNYLVSCQQNTILSCLNFRFSSRGRRFCRSELYLAAQAEVFNILMQFKRHNLPLFRQPIWVLIFYNNKRFDSECTFRQLSLELSPLNFVKPYIKCLLGPFICIATNFNFILVIIIFGIVLCLLNSVYRSVL